MIMESEESTTSMLSSPSTSSARPNFQPPHVSSCMVKLSKLRSFSDIVQSLRPNSKKTNIIRKILGKSSTRKLEATFLNGKRLTIQYIFNPTRLDGKNILIKLDCLSPIFGGGVPATLNSFSSISELCIFVKKELHLDECKDGRQAYCPCHPLFDYGEFYDVATPVVDECLHQHYHHYCCEHVVSWFYNYLNPLILLQESKELFDEEIAELYSFFPDDVVYFQTGSRTTPEFLLKTALEVDAGIYE